MDRCGFKVKYGGEEISCDCMEPVLSSFHSSNKKIWQSTQNFSACLKSKCHSILLSTLNLYLGDQLQHTQSAMVLFGSAKSYNMLQFFFQPSSHSCYSVFQILYKKPLAFIPEWLSELLHYHCITVNPPVSVWTTQQVLLLYPHQSLQLPDLMHHQCLLHVLHTTYTFSSPSSSSYEISHADTLPEAGTHSYR